MSPTVFRDGSYRAFFFSREEPRMHVHISSPGGEAKFGIEPLIALAAHTGAHRSPSTRARADAKIGRGPS